MTKWLKRRAEALLDNILNSLVTGLVAGLVVAGVVAASLAAWTLLTSPTGPAAVTIAIVGFTGTIFLLRQGSALIIERRQKKLTVIGKPYITLSLEDNFVISSGVAWQFNGAAGIMDGPLCPLAGHVITLDYLGREDMKAGPLGGLGGVEEDPPLTLGPSAQPSRYRAPAGRQKVRRPPREDDRVGSGGGKLVCPMGEEQYRLESRFILFGRGGGKTVGEARELALKEYEAKIRQRELGRPPDPKGPASSSSPPED